MLQELFDKVKNNEEITKDSHLAHFFFMFPQTYNVFSAKFDEKELEIDIGFYNTKTKKVFSYKVVNENIEFIPEQEIFQKDVAEVKEIALQDASLELTAILQKLAEHTFENYKDTISLKTMIVLQVLPDYGLVWNATILRRDFKTLNIKFDAKTGNIVSESLDSLIDMEKTLNK